MMKQLSASDRWIIVAAALAFWVLIPGPLWLIGMGFAGELVLWPSFASDVWLLSLVFVIAFYGPWLLIALVLADAVKAAMARRSKDANTNA